MKGQPQTQSKLEAGHRQRALLVGQGQPFSCGHRVPKCAGCCVQCYSFLCHLAASQPVPVSQEFQNRLSAWPRSHSQYPGKLDLHPGCQTPQLLLLTFRLC